MHYSKNNTSADASFIMYMHVQTTAVRNRGFKTEAPPHPKTDIFSHWYINKVAQTNTRNFPRSPSTYILCPCSMMQMDS